MTQDIKAFLDNLDPNFISIKEQAIKYFDDKSKIRDDGAAQIYNRPWIAPLNFGLLLFPPVEKNWLNIFTEKTSLEIPPIYKQVLLKMNGCFIYNFSLYGLPKSIYEEGILSRATLQQLSLESANNFWKVNYNIDQKLFYIGGRRFDENENLGYFIDENKILSIRKNGEVINSWDSFSDFINDELNTEEQYMLKTKLNQ